MGSVEYVGLKTTRVRSLSGEQLVFSNSDLYVLSPDYNVYMDIQQSIYFMIRERFEQAGIEFAYPTQKLYVVKNEVLPA